MTGGYMVIEAITPISCYFFLIMFLLLVAITALLAGRLISMLTEYRFCRKIRFPILKSKCFQCEKYLEDFEMCWWDS